VRLLPDRLRIRADGRDALPVAVEIIDAQGRVVPVADNEVSFSIEGAGSILGVGNGNPSSHEPDKGSRRRAFNGLAQVILQAGRAPGQMILTARAPGLLPAWVTIDMG
jgi:beta-galactosidase